MERNTPETVKINLIYYKLFFQLLQFAAKRKLRYLVLDAKRSQKFLARLRQIHGKFHLCGSSTIPWKLWTFPKHKWPVIIHDQWLPTPQQLSWIMVLCSAGALMTKGLKLILVSFTLYLPVGFTKLYVRSYALVGIKKIVIVSFLIIFYLKDRNG